MNENNDTKETKRSSSARRRVAAKASETARDTQSTDLKEYVRQKIQDDNRQQAESAVNGENVDISAIRKQFKKMKSQPSLANVRRFSPPVNQGLTSAQVNERFSQCLFNDTNQKYSKSYASIFIGNICTFFNLLCVLAAVALAFANAPLSQYLFVVIFALNLGFGLVMEIRAKRKIDKLSLLNVPTAKVLRDGEIAEIHAKDIVLDDIVLLSLGNQVPADCILADGSIEVNESLLTG